MILDDPLSAVDAHVGRQLMDEVIGSQGLLAGLCEFLFLLVCQESGLVLQWSVYLADPKILKERNTYQNDHL